MGKYFKSELATNPKVRDRLVYAIDLTAFTFFAYCAITTLYWHPDRGLVFLALALIQRERVFPKNRNFYLYPEKKDAAV